MKRLLILLILGLWSLECAAYPVKGSVRCENKPLSGVIVTDGYGFATTDDKGDYTLEVNPQAYFVYVVTPTGYLAPLKSGFPVFYQDASPKTKRHDFTLVRWEASENGYDLLAIGDPQPKSEKHFNRLCSEVIPPLRERTTATQPVPQAAIILGDIVWDSPELYPRVKEQFATLDIPIFAVIGNHDHDQHNPGERESEANYREQFGPTYYAFDLGQTRYIVLDDIEYHGRRDYKEQIDSVQIAWACRYAQMLPAGSRVCIAMHAPVMKSWREWQVMESAAPLFEAFRNHELHFLSGHTHINSNFDLPDGGIEHNVAQVCGNLWHDPINQDGTPRGYQLFSERDGEFSWQYISLGESPDHQIKVWLPGQVAQHPQQLVAKVWNWDSHWTVVWYEDGRYRGAMQRIEQLPDPDYVARLDSLRTAGVKLAGAQTPRPLNFYFSARPSAGARTIKIVATDRFGIPYSEQVTLP